MLWGYLQSSGLVSFLASSKFGGSEESLNIARQFGVQIYAAVFVMVYTAIISYIILKVVDLMVGLRVTDEEELEGLDVADHGEVGYDL